MQKQLQRKRYYCSELPPIIDYSKGVKVELFTGTWVDVNTLDTDGYNRKPTKQVTTAERIKVDKYFKDLETANIRDLPFKGIVEVTLYDWNDHKLILEYLGNFYKVSNFTAVRGVVKVLIRRTKYKGYLSVVYMMN